MHYTTPNFNSKCQQCNLGCGKGISGQSRIPFSQIKLIVVSSFVSSKEETIGMSLPDNPKRVGIPDSSKSIVGAGEYLRCCLEQFLDNNKSFPLEYKPIEKFTYFTNAIKCSPQRQKDKITILEKHIKACRDTWLINELDSLPDRAPIFACGKEAVKAILGTKENLYDNRNKILYYKNHPVIVSTNPGEWEKYATKYVKDTELARQSVLKIVKMGKENTYKKKIDRVIGSSRWKALPGSPLFFVKQDLALIREEVIKFINSN